MDRKRGAYLAVCNVNRLKMLTNSSNFKGHSTFVFAIAMTWGPTGCPFSGTFHKINCVKEGPQIGFCDLSF